MYFYAKENIVLKKSNLQHNNNLPHYVNKKASEKIQSLRKKKLDIDELITKIISQDRVALSQAITLIESHNIDDESQAQKILQACLAHRNESIRIGITGVPGVGKSTFIEAFGEFLTSKNCNVAVLAIDPSSTVSKGSILGDKTRMENLVKNKNAYIRPSASGETLGGVARKTRETILLCEAAGFNVIIIETVGVGQSETTVHGMVDFFLLLKIAGAGDELQGIKRGIMEMADLIVINKADGDNLTKAKLAQVEFKRALHLFPPKTNGWQPDVKLCSATEKTGILEIWGNIEAFLELTKNNSSFEENRILQNQNWLQETIEDQLKTNFLKNKKVASKLKDFKEKIQEQKLSPYLAAKELLQLYFNQ